MGRRYGSIAHAAVSAFGYTLKDFRMLKETNPTHKDVVAATKLYYHELAKWEQAREDAKRARAS